MSLRQILELRRGGHRPNVVTVIVGRPRRLDDGPDKVVVDRADEDLTPLLGLPVHVIDVGADSALMLRVIEQLEDLRAQALGVCGPAGACGVSPEHERAMQLYREALCRTG